MKIKDEYEELKKDFAGAKVERLRELVRINEDAQHCLDCVFGEYCVKHHNKFWNKFKETAEALKEKL